MKNFNNKYDAIILCGGLGTRFQSISTTIPKSLAMVSGKPLLKWLLDDLKKHNFKRYILATGHLQDKIKKYVETEKEYNCIISNEVKMLGTGGAIKNAEQLIKSELFLVLNGDSRIKIDFLKFLNFHIQKKADITILLSSIVKGKEFGNVEISKDSKIVNFSEKHLTSAPGFTNAGVYCMNLNTVKEIKKNKYYSLENDLLPFWILNKSIYGFVVDKTFTDIGTPKRYVDASFN